jgi:AcrR family transcriptional regulator
MVDRKPTGTRPRVEGERESEILEAALALLAQVGYDRMTMDAIAAEAKAGKATLYRRWSTKASLVVDALLRSKQALQAPAVDTGSLREDLIAMSCGQGGLTDQQSAGVMAGVITAPHHDPDSALEFRTRVDHPRLDTTALHHDAAVALEFRPRVVHPRLATPRVVFERARERGEIAADLDLDLLAPALAGIVLHRSFVLGLDADEKTVAQVVDQIILPAATRTPAGTTSTTTPDPNQS